MNPAHTHGSLTSWHITPLTSIQIIHGIVARVVPASNGQIKFRTPRTKQLEIHGGVIFAAVTVVEQCDNPCRLRDSDDGNDFPLMSFWGETRNRCIHWLLPTNTTEVQNSTFFLHTHESSLNLWSQDRVIWVGYGKQVAKTLLYAHLQDEMQSTCLPAWCVGHRWQRVVWFLHRLRQRRPQPTAAAAAVTCTVAVTTPPATGTTAVSSRRLLSSTTAPRGCRCWQLPRAMTASSQRRALPLATTTVLLSYHCWLLLITTTALWSSRQRCGMTTVLPLTTEWRGR